MKNIFKEVYQHRVLLWNFVLRDLRGRYAGSAMGVFWNIINPLLMLSIYTFVFSYIMKAEVPNGVGTDIFAIYLFCGFLPWIAVSEAINRNANIILDNSNLISKVRFPAEILVIYVVISGFIHELLAFSLLFLLLLATGSTVGAKVLFLPVFFIFQLIFTLGLSFFISSLNVFLRDTAHVAGAIVSIWFFATPIIYPLQIVPEQIRAYMGINPMTQLVEIYRDLILGNRFHSPTGTFYFILVSVTLFAVGAIFFSKTKKEFPDLI